MTCKYCKQEILDPTGWSMSEDMTTGEGSAMHDECWQQSGEDGGYVERMYRAIEEMNDEA